MNSLFLAKILNNAITTLVQRAQLNDSERIEISEFHEEWQEGNTYGSNQYIKFGVAENGRAVLYRTTRNISSATTPPTEPTSPQQYVLVGSSKNGVN